MADSSPSLAELAAEEEELQFGSFTNDDAWDLGAALVAAARRNGAPVAVDVSRRLGPGPADALHVERVPERVRPGLHAVQLDVGERGVPADRPGDVPAVHHHVPDVELLEGRADRRRPEEALVRLLRDGRVVDRRR